MEQTNNHDTAVIKRNSRLNFENPFLNPTILETVFRACDTQTLENCRLVLPLWHEVSHDAWSEKAVLRVTSTQRSVEETVLMCSEHSDVSTQVTLEKLLELLKKRTAAHLPLWQKFKLLNLNLIQLSVNIFHEFGPTVKHLELSECCFHSRKQLSALLAELPNLEKLVLSGILMDNSQNEGGQSLKECRVELEKLTSLRVDTPLKMCRGKEKAFFRQFPNLKSLTLNLIAVARHLEVIFQSIGRIRGEDSDKLQIRKLDLMPFSTNFEKLPSSTIDDLIALNWPLEKLAIDLGHKTEETDIRNLLTSLASSAKELTFHRLPFSRTLHDFPFALQMNFLRKLHLHGNVTDNFGFLKFTPNLECLHMFYERGGFPQNVNLNKVFKLKVDPVEQTLEKFDMIGVRLEKLEELRGDFQVEAAENFVKLTEWMPKVRVLYVRLNQDTFPVVCHVWRHTLRSLEIPKFCYLDDEAITGFPPLWQQAFSPTHEPRDRRPNISYLLGLTNFSMELPESIPDQCPHTIAEISDHSVEHGFLHLLDLEKLSIYTSGPLMKRSMKALQKRIEVVNVIDTVNQCPCGKYSLNE